VELQSGLHAVSEVPSLPHCSNQSQCILSEMFNVITTEPQIMHDFKENVGGQ